MRCITAVVHYSCGALQMCSKLLSISTTSTICGTIMYATFNQAMSPLLRSACERRWRDRENASPFVRSHGLRARSRAAEEQPARPNVTQELCLSAVKALKSGDTTLLEEHKDLLPSLRCVAKSGDLTAQVLLALFYRTKGSQKDLVEARRWSGLAASQEDADSLCHLGDMLFFGIGGQPDALEARRLYGRAGAQGHAPALFKLGIMHSEGIGGLKNEVEARRVYRLAAAQGHVLAQYNLGNMLGSGRGGSQDLAQACHLFLLASAQGEAAAQHALAVMYLLGEGGPQDESEARRLNGLAAAQARPR